MRAEIPPCPIWSSMAIPTPALPRMSARSRLSAARSMWRPAARRWSCWRIGQTGSLEDAKLLASRVRDPAFALAALAESRAAWVAETSVLRIKTNQPEFDRLVNDWLPYQLLASRLWGRTGPAQRSGATGYRDQLQDVIPLIFLDPRARAGANSAACGASVHRGRRGQMVAPGAEWRHRSWRSHPRLGPASVAALCRLALRERNRRHGHTRLRRAVPRSAARSQGPGRRGDGAAAPRATRTRCSAIARGRSTIRWRASARMACR